MKKSITLQEQSSIDTTYQSIRAILEKARSTAYRAVNFAMVQAYWEIGRIIVEEEQKGAERAEYGKALVKEFSVRLTRDYGKGFNESNLKYMRQFYLTFPNSHALRDELSWTHYRLLLKVEKEEARNFYMLESVKDNWSTRVLERQVNSLLYERLALSKDREKVLELSTKGQVIQEPADIIKDPYVLEFLDLKESRNFLEKDMEHALIDKLQAFLLELGKGFSFVARQRRITVDGDHYYIDLVFYNYILKCFVLIDLKVGKLTHQDIGQMDFYARYFENEEKLDGDNSSIGLILCSDKNETMVRYTLLEDSKQVFASKYKLYLPTERELKAELERERRMLEVEGRLRGNFDMFGDPAMNPKGWEVDKLNEIAAVNPRNLLPDSWNDEKEVGFIQMENIDEETGEIRQIEIKKLSQVRSGKTRFKEKDVLFAKITPCVENKKVALVRDMPSEIGFGSTEFHVIRAKDDITVQKFLLYLARMDYVREQAILSMTGTSGRKRVPVSFLKNFDVPLPSLDLQQEFAEIVSKLEDKRKQMEEAEEKLEMLYQILLKQAFTGKLTEEWGREGNASKSS